MAHTPSNSTEAGSNVHTDIKLIHRNEFNESNFSDCWTTPSLLTPPSDSALLNNNSCKQLFVALATMLAKTNANPFA